MRGAHTVAHELLMTDTVREGNVHHPLLSGTRRWRRKPDIRLSRRGGDGAIKIGRKPENHYPSGPREWIGDVTIPPADFSELVARLLERGGYEDVQGVRDALDVVSEGVRDHEQDLRDQTDPRSVVLSDEGRDTIARLWLDGVLTDDEAEELADEDAFESIKDAREAVKEDVEWELEPGTADGEDWENSTLNERVEAEWVD